MSELRSAGIGNRAAGTNIGTAVAVPINRVAAPSAEAIQSRKMEVEEEKPPPR
jgi:hypothetical protein